MKTHLERLFRHQSLSRAEARSAMAELISGASSPESVAAFLGALRAKGESAEELAGFVDEMLARAERVAGAGDALLDVCGTGGDASGSFNVSTATAILLAAMGVPVAKHGNRSVSSRCGSIDVLEALGIACATQAHEVLAQLKEHSISFLFAPHFHPALKSVAAVRKAIGIRTTFNVLGPLANPALVSRQLIGVYEPGLTRVVAEAARMRGISRALVVHSEDGMDELSISAITRGHHWDGQAMREFSFDPASVGILGRKASDLQGGDAAENARIIADALDSVASAPDVHREAIALNAGAGLYVHGSAATVAEGYARAMKAIRSGDAGRKLKSLRKAVG